MSGRLTEQLRNATREQSRLRPVEPRSDLDDSGGSDKIRGPFGWPSLLVVAALVLGGWFVFRQMQADSKLQDCFLSGRKNCAPIDSDSLRGSPTPP
jgi:hypothetical protein